MILASIKPYYYYLIGEGKKKIEVRKSALKNLPQDIVFYMSKDEKSFAKIPKEFQEKYRKHFGKVGLRVVCDKVEIFSVGSLRCDDIIELACVSYREMINYFYKPEELDGRTSKRGYAWFISNLRIYDKPKELSEFFKPCPDKFQYCKICKYGSVILSPDEEEYALYHGGNYDTYETVCNNRITRPSQSYMWVEEL